LKFSTIISYNTVNNWNDENRPVPPWVKSWLDNYVKAKDMDSLLFLIVVVVMIIFVYKVLIEPLLNPKKEKRSSNYIVEVEDDEYLTDSRTVRTTQVSANLSPELYKRLNTYCENNNITKTSVINKAVDKYLDEI